MLAVGRGGRLLLGWERVGRRAWRCARRRDGGERAGGGRARWVRRRRASAHLRAEKGQQQEEQRCRAARCRRRGGGGGRRARRRLGANCSTRPPRRGASGRAAARRHDERRTHGTAKRSRRSARKHKLGCNGLRDAHPASKKIGEAAHHHGARGDAHESAEPGENVGCSARSVLVSGATVKTQYSGGRAGTLSVVAMELMDELVPRSAVKREIAPAIRGDHAK